MQTAETPELYRAEAIEPITQAFLHGAQLGEEIGVDILNPIGQFTLSGPQLNFYDAG